LHRESSKAMSIFRLPPVLLLHLKRFSTVGTGGSRRKIAKKVAPVSFKPPSVIFLHWDQIDSQATSSTLCIYCRWSFRAKHWTFAPTAPPLAKPSCTISLLCPTIVAPWVRGTTPQTVAIWRQESGIILMTL
jgi:hypothetical protein